MPLKKRVVDEGVVVEGLMVVVVAGVERGARKVLPAPPRPARTYVVVVGTGSVMTYFGAIVMVVMCGGGRGMCKRELG